MMLITAYIEAALGWARYDKLDKLGHKLPVLAGIDLNKVHNGRMATA
jgi:hypothetical protein